MFKFLGSLLDSNEREVNKLNPLVDQTNNFEKEIKNLTDAKLRAKTDEFKKRLEKGESLEDVLPETFAVVREALLGKGILMSNSPVELSFTLEKFPKWPPVKVKPWSPPFPFILTLCQGKAPTWLR